MGRGTTERDKKACLNGGVLPRRCCRKRRTTDEDLQKSKTREKKEGE